MVDAMVNEIHHDVIAGRNRIFDRALSAAYQILCIAEPDVCTMGKAGDSNEVGKDIGVCVIDHLAGEWRAKFGDAEGAARGAEFLRRDAERGR